MTVKENGKVTEVIPYNVGFRRIEINKMKEKRRMYVLNRRNHFNI